jgi:hypothetical protein
MDQSYRKYLYYIGCKYGGYLKPEEGYVQVNNNNDSSNDNGSGVIQNQTINYHTSEN